MAAPVFYSVSMFGTGSIETGSGTVSITDGVATFSVAQTGNIGVGLEIEYNSIKCYIAPNRIGFDAGSTEISVGNKITDATSGATGIVRFVEVTGGTWSGNDAAGWIYFEKTTGTFGNNNVINITKPTVTNSVAVVNGSIEGNIGNGNTEFVVKSAIGADAANQGATAVTSIHHVWATLSAFEGAFTGASYINNVDLTAADVVAHACCYYDHDDYTQDSTTVTIDWSGTVDSTRHLKIFSPMGVAESINKQRHAGIWDDNKAVLTVATGIENLLIATAYTKVEGLQLYHSYGSNATAHNVYVATAIVGLEISCCIIKASEINVYCLGIRINNSGCSLTVWNSVIYKTSDDGGTQSEGIYCDAGTLNSFHNTIYLFNDGVERDAGTLTLTNNIVFNNDTDFDGTITATYCASDDTKVGAGNIDWDNGATDWANVFTDYANADFSLKNYTTVGIAVIEQGTSLASSQGIWRDIAGNERGATPDIGAFEYVAAAGITVNCTLGTLTIVKFNSNISVGTDIDSTLGAVSITGLNSEVSQGVGINCTLGEINITGLNLGISVGIGITPTLGQINILGLGVAISEGIDIDSTLGEVSISGLNTDISEGINIDSTLGQINIDKFNADILVGINIDGSLGSINIVGLNVDVDLGVIIEATLGEVNITGKNTAVEASIVIDSILGLININGLNADISLPTNIDCTKGNISVSSLDADIISTVLVDVELGLINVAGLIANIQIGELVSSPFKRTLFVEAENRVLTIEAENRTLMIEQENRIYTIT